MAAPQDFSKLFDSKKIYKQQYAEMLSLPFSHDVPVVGYRVRNKDDAVLLESMREGAKALGLPFLVFEEGSKKPHAEDLWRACDVAFCFSDEDVIRAFAAGIVPLVPTGLLGAENYDPNREKGNSFVYHGMSQWSMFSALVRATETFKFPFDWKCVVKNGKR